MNKVATITLLMCFIILTSFGQSNTESTFPAEHINLLVGRILIVNSASDSLQNFGLKGFYKDWGFNKVYKKTKNKTSKYQELVNKNFTVLTTTKISEGKYKVKLENLDIGILYYDYFSELSQEFPFTVIGDIKYPEENIIKTKESTLQTSLSLVNQNIDPTSQEYAIKQLATSLKNTQDYLLLSSRLDNVSLTIGIVGALIGSAILVVPLATKVDNTLVLTGIGAGIVGLSAILSVTVKFTAIKNKKRAGSQVKF
jgi:hypothetical protein